MMYKLATVPIKIPDFGAEIGRIDPTIYIEP